LLGITHEARQLATRLRSEGRLRRRYVAIAVSTPEPPIGEWSSTLGSVRGSPKQRISPDGKPALTRFRVTGVAGHFAGGTPCVLALEPLTGRTHQLRVQAAAHGAALFGDPTYGGPRQLVLSDGAVRPFERVFLHACWVELGGGPKTRVEAPVPPDFASVWQAAGGGPGALDSAASVELSP
jgi:23S rRNA-/tRNA-specific pseudouridylate synthase